MTDKEISITDFYGKLTDESSSENPNRWIHVSERLPNRYEYIKNRGMFIVSDGDYSYAEKYDFYDKQKFGEPTMNGFRIDYAVIAWMPFPEPYNMKARNKI